LIRAVTERPRPRGIPRFFEEEKDAREEGAYAWILGGVGGKTRSGEEGRGKKIE